MVPRDDSWRRPDAAATPRSTQAIVAEAMITDAFLAASESEFRITAISEDGTCREFTLGEAASDCGAFTQLRDGLLETLQTSSASGLERTRHILERLNRREFYHESRWPPCSADSGVERPK